MKHRVVGVSVLLLSACVPQSPLWAQTWAPCCATVVPVTDATTRASSLRAHDGSGSGTVWVARRQGTGFEPAGSLGPSPGALIIRAARAPGLAYYGEPNPGGRFKSGDWLLAGLAVALLAAVWVVAKGIH